MVERNVPSLLVAVNLEDTESYALELGLTTASRWPGARVHVLYVITTAHLYAYEGKTILRQQEAALARAPARLRERVDAVKQKLFGHREAPEIALHVRVGAAAQGILQAAVDFGADMIVVGTHDRRGLARLALGSVAQEVARSARCAVLIARRTNYDGLEKSPELAEGAAVAEVSGS